MPWWVAIYFALYITFSLWSLTDDIRKEEVSIWNLAPEVFCDVLLVFAAMSFWLGPSIVIAGHFLLAAFSVGSGGLGLLLLHSLRKHVFDPELPMQGRVFVAISGSLLSLGFGGPLVYWGFQSAVLHSYAGT